MSETFKFVVIPAAHETYRLCRELTVLLENSGATLVCPPLPDVQGTNHHEAIHLFIQQFDALFQTIFETPPADRTEEQRKQWRYFRHYVDLNHYIERHPIPHIMKASVIENNDTYMALSWYGVSTPEQFDISRLPNNYTDFLEGSFVQVEMVNSKIQVMQGIDQL